jgi:ribose transport system substrate-binding protein
MIINPEQYSKMYWQSQEKAEQGVTANCNGPANESDISDQVQMINDAIAKAPAGIGLAACDTNSVLDQNNKINCYICILTN